MSDHKKPARSVNRLGIGVLTLIQLVLLVFCVIALNWLGARHYWRGDFSRTGDYSLSRSTISYLGSSDLTSREQAVKLTLVWRRSAPFYERIRALCEEYSRQSGGRIAFEAIDPMRSASRSQEISAAYGISLVRDLVIVDARSDDTPPVRQDAEGIKSLNPHVRIATSEDIVAYGTRDKQRSITGFRGEEVLTARLVAAIEGAPRTMGIVLDKSSIANSLDSPLLKSLSETLHYQNIDLAPLHLAGLDQIPGNLSGIILAAPKYDFTDEEIQTLEKYWNSPRAAILTLLDAGETPAKLRIFLRSLGITPRIGRIITRNGEALDTSARGFFTRGVSFTADLAGQSTTFDGASSSLDVRETDSELINRRIYPMSLIAVAPGYWGETAFGQGKESFEPSEDDALPLSLAASVIRGNEADDQTAADSSRMVVISNTSFLSTENKRAENFDFLASSVNWLVGRESLVGKGPLTLGTYKLPLLQAQVTFINRVNLFFIPAALLLIGAFIWNARRA